MDALPYLIINHDTNDQLCLFAAGYAIGTVSANSVESDHGCVSRIYFDAGDNVTLPLYNVALTSNKPC